MVPDQLIGKDAWRTLQSGSELVGTYSDGNFVTRKFGWTRRFLQRVVPRNWLGVDKKRRAAVKLIERKVARNFSDRRRVILKMAAAGLLEIQAVAAGGELKTVPGRRLNRRAIERLCEAPDTMKELVGKIDRSATRKRLRTSYFHELLQEDLETLAKQPQMVTDTQSVNLAHNLKQMRGRANLEIVEKGILKTTITGAELKASVDRLQSGSPVPTNKGEALQYSLDQLIVRAYMAKCNLIDPGELQFSWQYLCDTLDRLSRPYRWTARELFSKSVSSVAPAKTEILRQAQDTVQVVDLDQVAEYRRLAKTQYRPDMERAERSPGLKNLGNKCYYNSIIKLLANQYSMDDLNWMDDQKRPVGQDETNDSDLLIAQRQVLRNSLVALLRSIKLCRAGIVTEADVNRLNAQFVRQMTECRGDQLIRPLFSGASQEDAHEFTQIVNKLLVPASNPRFSYQHCEQKSLFFGGRIWEKPSVHDRETAVYAMIEKGKSADCHRCLQVVPEERTYFWSADDVRDMGIDPEDVLKYQRENGEVMQEMLDNFREGLPKGDYDADFVSEVEAMTFDSQSGYFERPRDAERRTVQVILPPWVTTAYQSDDRVGKDFSSILMTPKIFDYKRGRGIKLAKEGSEFFLSTLSGVNMPLRYSDGDPVSVMDVAGISCHRGSWLGGHYVYIERTDQGWLLHDDSVVRNLGDDNALKVYLGQHFTPYVYHMRVRSRPGLE